MNGKPLRLGWCIFAVIVFGCALAIRIRLLGIPLERDEGEYAYAGQLMLQGIPPYKLAYNMKFPGTYAAYAVMMSIFGQTIFGIHLGLLLVNSAAVALIFLLGRRLMDSTAGIAAAIVLAIFAPRNAFLKLYGSAVAAMLFVWLVILRTHLRFRKTLSREQLLRLPMRLGAHPFFTLLNILFIVAIAATTFFVDGLQWSIPTFSIFLGLISLLYLLTRHQKI